MTAIDQAVEFLLCALASQEPSTRDPRDERCFLPIHVYDTATSRPVVVLLRPGTTPAGSEIRDHLRRLVRRIRQHWPNTRLPFAAMVITAVPK